MKKKDVEKLTELAKRLVSKRTIIYPAELDKYRVSYRDRLWNQKKQLENKAFEQDISLKRKTLVALFIFLGAETFLIFLYSLFQAVKVFKLEEWSFKLLIAATITQITFMLQVAVKHLFPQK